MLRPKTTICREGCYYLVIIVLVFGGAMLKEVNLLLVLAGMLLGPLLLNWKAVRVNLRGLTFRRTLPLSVCAGDTLSVDLHVTNTRRRLGGWAVAAEETIHRESGSSVNHNGEAVLRPSVFFPYVHAGRSRKGAYRGRLVKRGRYRFEPLRVSTRFPFGLFARTVTVGEPETLIVLPRLGRLTRGWATRRQTALAGTDRRRAQPGPEGDFYGVREWRCGDGRRVIHWRTSARLGKLAVRQFERPQSRDVAVLLDLWRPEAARPEDDDNVELAVSFAATVLADACRKGGSNVALGVHNSEPECFGGSASSAVLQNFMERLAIAESRPSDTLPALLGMALRQIPAAAEIILVATRPVDLTDTERFAELRSDPMLCDRMSRILCVDASSEELNRYFCAE